MSIIHVVMAVALFAAITLGGVQYISADAQIRIRIGGAAEAGFQTLESAFRARQAAGLPAPSVEGWEATLFPAYGTKPTPPKDLAWSYGMDATGTWFCLSGMTQDRPTREALDRLKARFAEGLYAVGEGCGDGAGAGAPGAVAATYWVAKAAS